jgi:serine/threonine protein kinase
MKNSRYHILGEVGQGQFGQVFCASDRETGQLVAMKRLEPLRFPTHRFLRELAVLVRLQHPNIVGLHGLEYTAAGRYLVIDYCQGGTLRSLMESKLDLSLAQRLQIVRDILLGLEHIHQNRIIHCDLKPENILLKVIAQGWSAQIADFGIAHFQEATGRQDPSSGNTGSPAYMAPERFYGEYSPESDLYAVGVLLFELVVGRRPFSGMPGDIMKAHLNQPLRVPRSLPPMLRSIVSKALQKLPQNRYGSATSMRMMLEAVIANLNYSGPLSETLSSAEALGDESLEIVEDERPQHRSFPRVRELSLLPTDLQRCVELEGTVCGLWLRPQGCFIAANRGQDIELSVLPPNEPLQPVATFSGLVSQSLHQTSKNLDLDPLGQWFAVLRSQDRAAEASVSASRSESDSQLESILQIFKLHGGRDCTQQATVNVAINADRLWFSSSRHLLVAHSPTFDAEERSTATLQLWNRRGQRYWSHALPTPIQQAVQIGHNHIFAVTDEAEPMSLWIDLLPFRVRQVPLGIKADWVSATRWGYVLMSRTGTALYLNRRGRVMVKTALPIEDGSRVSAIATSDRSNLLWIAIQSGSQSTLYTLDMSLHLPKALLLL